MAGVEFSLAEDVNCGSFFDHIDDFLDIPDESCNNLNGENDFLCEDYKDFPTIWTESDDAFKEPKSVFSENNSNSSSDLSNELYVPYEDIAQLEWLSTFVEDSFSPGNSLTIDVVANSVPNNVVSPSPTQFQMSSPISVLESSSSNYAGGKVMPVKLAAPASGRCGRARSERPRPPTFTRRPSMQLISPSSSFTKVGNSEFECFGEFGNSFKIRKSAASSTEHKKKKKIKLSESVEVDQNENPNPFTPQGAVRKCQHCEITKTPQWRAGPMGPKTLCNACGVRYKSGRLFPEYRPAASPTFVPTIHSNSHKKVLEMRVKTFSQTGSPLIEEDSCNTDIELVLNKNI